MPLVQYLEQAMFGIKTIFYKRKNSLSRINSLWISLGRHNTIKKKNQPQLLSSEGNTFHILKSNRTSFSAPNYESIQWVI